MPYGNASSDASPRCCRLATTSPSRIATFQGKKSQFLPCLSVYWHTSSGSIALQLSLQRKRDTVIQRECAKLHRQLLVIAYKYLRCLPCSLIPKGCPGHKSGRIPALLPVNIFCFSIIGGKLKAEKHALWAALRSAACGGALRRCAAPSAAARRFAPPLRGATRPARCARRLFGNTKKMPINLPTVLAHLHEQNKIYGIDGLDLDRQIDMQTCVEVGAIP